MPKINLGYLYTALKMLAENPAVRHFGKHLMKEQASMQPFKTVVYKEKQEKLVKLVEGLNARFEKYNEDFKKSVDDYVSMELGNSQPQIDMTTKVIEDFIARSAEFVKAKSNAISSAGNSINLNSNPTSLQLSNDGSSKKK